MTPNPNSISNSISISILLTLLLVTAAPTAAQHALGSHGSYDPSIPTPESVLGYELGDTFTPHHLIVRYASVLAEASPRVRLDTLAFSHEGRPVLLATVTSEANMARLEEIRRDNQRLADPRGASDGELRALADRAPAVVWLAYTVHGDEASGVEAALGTLYQLAAGQDAETLRILENVVTLIDPVQNPDGHDRHVFQVAWDRGDLGPDTHPRAVVHGHDWHGARTNHYLFDLNRDWIVHAHPETRGRMAALREWYPHVAVDLHEMGASSTYFFPPPMEPVHGAIHPLVREGWALFARGNAAAFDAEGWGYFTREGFDEYFPGYGPSWPIHTGAIGMTYEQASSEGGAIRRDDGTVLTLREAARHHYTSSRATLLTAADHRADRVGDYLTFRQDAVAAGGDDGIRTIVLQAESQGRTDTLVTVLLRHGIEVGRVTDATRVRATSYGATDPTTMTLPVGSYVVDLAQPQGVLARTLLEPDPQLDPAFVEDELARRAAGLNDRFYDMTGWALPYLFRVDAAWSGDAVRAVEPVRDVATASPPPPDAARYAYAFAPGSEASFRLLAGLLTRGVRVRHAPEPFTVDGHAFPGGAFLVQVTRNDPAELGAPVHDVVTDLAGEAGVPVVALNTAFARDGTDLGSNSVEPIPAPRVALATGDNISSYSYGAAWHAFDKRLRLPVTRLELDDLIRSIDDFNVVVLPSAFGLDNALGRSGVEALQRWVRDGGTLVTLDAATAWVASDDGLARLREKPEAQDDDAPRSASVPGAILRAVSDSLPRSPLLAGVTGGEIPVMLFGRRVYQAPADAEPGEVVLRYADADRLRLAGFMWPESPERVAGTPYLWTEEVGGGRVIAFTGDPNFRAMWRGLLPLFANAVLLGGTF